MSSTAGEPYEKDGEPHSKTEGGVEKYQEKSSKSEDFKNVVADALSKIPVSKLFVILAMIVYAVIAYSKKENGVDSSDLSIFIFFLVFLVLVFIFLAVSSHAYRRYLKFFIINDTELNIFEEVYKFCMKKAFPIMVLIAIIFIYLLFKDDTITFLDNTIKWFNSF